MKESEFICRVCGKTFRRKACFAKFCPECKEQAYRDSRERHYQEAKVHRKVDTEEMMQMCLNCTREKCVGECEQLATLSRRIGNEKKCTAVERMYDQIMED